MSDAEVWARDAGALDQSLVTVNDWRARSGLPPVAWGGGPWAPMGKAGQGDGSDGPVQVQ